jgi:tripartite-type tricarboxylate transporter receptor subunit TctC
MSLNRRQMLAGLSVLGAPAILRAQGAFPTKPIEIIVPATAGGGADLGARRIGEMLSPVLGQPIVIQNKAGAAGSLAASMVARAEKTGHVIGMATDSSVLINPLVLPDITYQLEDFELLTPLYTGGMALAVHKDFPARTVQEFVAEARKRGDVNCTTFGTVSSTRLSAEMFMADANVKMNMVPYKGEAEAIRDVVANIAPAFFGTTATLLPQVRAGTMRVLAVSSTERNRALPDVPTFQELGLNKTVYRWFHGLMVPKGTPKPVVDKLASSLLPLVASEKFRNGIAADLTPAPMEPAAFTEMVYASRETVRRIIKERNLKAS